MRRVVFYLFFDPQGIVDEYVPYKLRALRPFADHIFVVSNSRLTPESRRVLREVADTVWVRENVGLDVWAYKDAMEAFGADRLAEFDELILMNYTFFAPIYPFSETFEAMDAREDLDFWGITAHGHLDANPFHGAEGELPLHIQSHWISVRKAMFTSLEFARYWRDMPMITSYDQSILEHESKFTQHFADRGFRYAVAFDPAQYPSDNPVFDSAVLLLGDRCPIVKRRIFFHEPTYLDRNAILGKRVMERVADSGYPVDLIWRNVVRSAEPRTLYTNMSMLSVLPDLDSGYRPDPAPRICVLAHIYYEDMTHEILTSLCTIPVPWDLVVTTTTKEKKASIEQVLAEHQLPRAEVRVVASNRGRAESAFIVSCRDVLTCGDYDLILKVHSKKSPQDDHNLADLFKHHTIDNLLSSTGYVASVLRLFTEQDSLGMVFPPVVNIGFPTLGHSWFTNRESAVDLARRLGIHTQFDRSTPVAPYGGMFWARPEALSKLLDARLSFEDFEDFPGSYGDGMLTHVLERLYGYVVMDAGFTLRCVINTDWAEINYAFLEYKLQRISSMLPPYTQEQVDYLDHVATDGPVLLTLKEAVDQSHPRLGRALRPPYRLARATRRGAHRILRKR